MAIYATAPYAYPVTPAAWASTTPASAARGWPNSSAGWSPQHLDVDPYTGLPRPPLVDSYPMPVGYVPMVRQPLPFPDGFRRVEPAGAPVTVTAPSQIDPVKTVLPEAAVVEQPQRLVRAVEPKLTTSTPDSVEGVSLPKNYADEVGQKVGAAVSSFIRQNPELEARLKAVNVDALLQNPDQLVGGLRDTYQKSRMLRWLTNRYGKQLIRVLPDNLEPSAHQVLAWLNGKEPLAVALNGESALTV